MCIWFWGYSTIFYINFFYVFDLVFQGSIIIRIDTLWTQFLLQFSTDNLETMHTCSTWSVDVHMVLGLSSHYLLFFCSSFSTKVFFQVRLALVKIPCGLNSS